MKKYDRSKLFDWEQQTGSDTDRDRYTLQRWSLGLIGPALLGLYGIACLLTGHARFLSFRPMRLVEFTGTIALALGVAYVSLACLSHARYYWAEHPKLWPYADLLTLIAAIGTLGGFASTFFFALL